MERDLYVMSMFLVMAQEVLRKFKQGIKLTMREKVICLGITAKTFESWERVTNKIALNNQQFLDKRDTPLFLDTDSSCCTRRIEYDHRDSG